MGQVCESKEQASGEGQTHGPGKEVLSLNPPTTPAGQGQVWATTLRPFSCLAGATRIPWVSHLGQEWQALKGRWFLAPTGQDLFLHPHPPHSVLSPAPPFSSPSLGRDGHFRDAVSVTPGETATPVISSHSDLDFSR